MDYIMILGFAAGALVTIAYVPQVIKVWKTKSTKDISLGMFVILCTATLLWLTYGILINSWPIILTNTSIFIMALIILIFKIKYK